VNNLVTDYPITAPTTVGDDGVGPMVTGADIEDAVLALLREWLPRYLVAAELQHELTPGSTPAPKGWAITGRDLQKLLTDQLPCIVLLAAGIGQAPRREGTGSLTATWGVDIGVVFNAAWGRESRRRAQLYARSVQLALQQRPLYALDQPCKVDWRGELYDELDFADSRSYSASVTSFNVSCREVARTDGGPPPAAVPPSDPTVPFVPWVEVTDTEVTVNNEGPGSDSP
jgi:hypothetical protein